MQSDGLTACSTEASFVASTVYRSRVVAASPSYHHFYILRMVIAVITIDIYVYYDGIGGDAGGESGDSGGPQPFMNNSSSVTTTWAGPNCNF